MPLDKSIRRVLVIGSGPVVIGQAAEFDYSGSQACLALREEGITTILLNPNPASIQTDREIADRIYLEPVLPDMIEEIIRKEKVDSILASVGGQTALNSVIMLRKLGIIQRNGVRILGTPVDSIELAEDRRLFHDLMDRIGEPVARSMTLDAKNYRKRAGEIDFYPVIIRSSFSLGGSGGNIAKDSTELIATCSGFFSSHPSETMELEKSLAGMNELEYEVIRDSMDSCITVCNMENVDPMGVHTGESIVVTPAQTLSDREHNMLRDSALRVVRKLGIVGACNIQFALDRTNGSYYVVEVNPRTSRSSALASKASGFPIARISAKIAAGYTLAEIRNPVTKDTYAAFEPAMDYVTVKIPRWPFDKFHVDRTIGVQMKSIGEVMGIGRTLEEAFMKAVASLENDLSRNIRLGVTDARLMELLSRPSDLRLHAVFEALFRNHDIDTLSSLTGYERYFLIKLSNIVREVEKIEIGRMPSNLAELKSLGVSDAIISSITRLREVDITRARIEAGLIPSFRIIDTCAGEFRSETPYFYSTYGETGDMIRESDRKKVLIIGAGPNRIAQGIEFDYCSVKAVRALRKSGFTAIMINSNPETVSTDFDVSDRLFFEPVTLEHVSNVVAIEKPYGVMVQFSGQTGQNIAGPIAEIFGENIILGTSPSQIDRAENRTEFSRILGETGFRQPEYTSIYNLEDALGKTPSIGLPAIVRSSFVIGGRSMEIIYDMDELLERVREIFSLSPSNPAIISRYLEDATEIDVDFVSDGKETVICGIMEHIEEAGTHSGDATMILPASLSPEIMTEIKRMTVLLAKEFHIVGIANLQIAVRNSEVFVIELNTRASRTVPIISKATGTDWIEYAVRLIMNTGKIGADSTPIPDGYFVKVPVFPFDRFADLDILLGPEMRSTGEGVGVGKTVEEAIVKAFTLTSRKLSVPTAVLFTVDDRLKNAALPLASFLASEGVKIYATPGTHAFLRDNGIDSSILYKLEDVRKPLISDAIRSGEISTVVNIPGPGAIREGFEIRRIALAGGVLVLTNLRLATAYFRSVMGTTRLVPREIQEYQP